MDYRALHCEVLVVAKANLDVGDWKAYCAPVPGESHDDEWQAVVDRGSPIAQDLAEFLFPQFAERFSWRR